MCAAIDRWRYLSSNEQCRLTLLLHALGFYTFNSNRIPSVINAETADDTDLTELAYLGASARYVLGRPDRVADYHHADLTEFEKIAGSAHGNKLVSFNAALKILVHNAKTGASLQELPRQLKRLQAILDMIAADVDEFTFLLLESRFYRAAAFIPQRQSDRNEVVRVMDLAEHKAFQMIPTDAGQELLWRENLHPLMESRTKEALWLGDLDLALARSLRVIELDPYDSKAWLELGQVRLRRQEIELAAEAYVVAATLGPPASAIARHMAGICFRDLGKPQFAAFFFQGALEIDPKAISPRDEIQRLPETPVLNALKDWSMSTFEL
jgi:tetratricopeptide (TPR) repeat protein